MSEHTPGKLEVLDDRRISVTLPPLIEDCGYTSHCVAMTYGGDERVNSHANARRLVAAWNACDGISTERLEDLGRPLMAHLIGCDERAARQVKEADSLRAVNAELVAVLENLTSVIDSAGLYNLSRGVELGSTVWYVKATDGMDAARAAIAKAQGEQP